MRKTVKHPSQREFTATIGTDRALGVFVNIERNGRLVGEYDGLRRGYDGVPGALCFLAHRSFFSKGVAAEALRWIQHSFAVEAEEADVRFAAEIAEYLYHGDD